MDPRDALHHAEQAIAAADREMARAHELLTIRAASIWLQRHGVQVHENTVRHWTRTGRIPTIRRPGGVLIARTTLEHVAACPFCASR